MSPAVSGTSSSARSASAAVVAIDRDERLGIAEVRDRPDRPFEAESPELVPEVGCERDRGVDAAHDRAPPESTNGSPHVRREPENALPHDDRSAPAAREHRGLDRPAPVRDQDVDGLEREVTAQRSRAEPQRAQALRRNDASTAADPRPRRRRIRGRARAPDWCGPSESSPRASSTATSSAPRRWLRVTRCRIRTGPIVACEALGDTGKPSGCGAGNASRIVRIRGFHGGHAALSQNRRSTSRPPPGCRRCVRTSSISGAAGASSGTSRVPT